MNSTTPVPTPKERFSDLLHDLIKDYYEISFKTETRDRISLSLTSPSDFSKFFTEKHPHYPISKETARNWLKGLGLPSLHNFDKLIECFPDMSDHLASGLDKFRNEAYPIELRSIERPKYGPQPNEQLDVFKSLGPEDRHLILTLIERFAK
ncbi:hypothetical protein [Caballeronia sp. KNU42]